MAASEVFFESVRQIDYTVWLFFFSVNFKRIRIRILYEIISVADLSCMLFLLKLDLSRAGSWQNSIIIIIIMAWTCFGCSFNLSENYALSLTTVADFVTSI